MDKKIKNIYLGLTCLLVLIVAGCVATAEMFHGNFVSTEQVISIEGPGPKNDRLENFNVKINYEFARVDDALKISGQVVLTERYPLLYGQLRYLYVYLFFVDETSRVLETVSLATAMTGDPYERLEFSTSLNVPTGAVGISFGYDGEVREGEDESSGIDNFYSLPLKK